MGYGAGVDEGEDHCAHQHLYLVERVFSSMSQSELYLRGTAAASSQASWVRHGTSMAIHFVVRRLIYVTTHSRR